MKILIAVDMEGISGVVNWDQVTPGHPEYGRFRKIMTADVNAAIRGAFDAGAQEVCVADGHSHATNLLIEELDPRAHLNTGDNAPLAMVQGVDGGVDAVFFVGYHARAGTTHAILDHTWSSARVANLWLNNKLVGETGLNASLCGHYNAPVVMLSGDEAVCAEALDLLGKIEVAAVKRATSRTSAECLPPEKAQEKICEAAGKAVQRLAAGEFKEIFKMNTPVEVKLELFNSSMADRAALLPGALRLDGRRIAFTCEDMLAAYTGMQAAIDLAGAV
jgi:D-amino peptidase